MKKKEPRWKQEQKERKSRKSRLWVRWFLLLAVLLLLGGLTVKIFRIVQSSGWDGKERATFAVVNDGVGLVSFSPKDKELVLLLIPNGTQIELTHGYGFYRIEAITRLEEIEKRKDLLQESLGENFGIAVNGWMKSAVGERGLAFSQSEILDELVSQIEGRGETNLSFWDLVRLWWQIRGVRSDKIHSFDLGQMDILKESRLADQEMIFTIDRDLFDTRVGKFFLEPRFKTDGLTIEVLNGTSYPGLANQAARIVTNLGGEVVWVGDSGVKSSKSKVQSQKDKRNLYPVKKLIQIFGGFWEEKEEGRADITLILGEDYLQKLNQK